jgi:hypothetical protein
LPYLESHSLYSAFAEISVNSLLNTFLDLETSVLVLLDIAIMAGPEIVKQYVPLTCHGHSRPVTHLSFSSIAPGEEGYYLISACKGLFFPQMWKLALTRFLDNNPMLRDGLTGDW